VGAETSFCDGDCSYAMCGDGYHNMLSEQCDDGNAANDDGCVGSCQLNVCGDAMHWVGMEDCDDGNGIDTDECKNDCTHAICGDGVIQDEIEQCEDLNMVDDDACTNMCLDAACGDGILWADMEVCDDGNFDDGDSCPGSCEPAVCGDGFTHDGVEACDDGNDIDNDGCTNNCISMSPSPCTQGVDPGSHAPWVVCSASPELAWLSADTHGQYHPVLICQNLGYATVGQWGGTCGNACGFCQAQTSCQNPGSMSFNLGNWEGTGNCGSDVLGPIICQAVHWTCINI
jgi:cysteine-rich repeat protein